VEAALSEDLDLNALHLDEQGRFDVLLSRERPSGHTGAWWPLSPSAAKLLMRLVSSNWGAEQDPAICIERLDAPVRRPRPSAAALQDRMRRLADATNFIVPLRVGQPERLRREVGVNRLQMRQGAQMGVLAGQFYYDGAYELDEGEALLLETRVPARFGYWSMLLTNHLYETLDWYNNQSSLNDSQARPDADGVLRVVIAAADPGVPNWLDTAGYTQGVIQGRWYDCDTQPLPSLRKVRLAQLRRSLPAATPRISPEERDRVIRERRAAYLQRPLW
jgi:hypothetical protein